MLKKRLLSTKTKQEVEKAFSKRLQELEDSYPSENDALLGRQYKSLIDKDDQLSNISENLTQKTFNYENQKAILTSTKIPSYASRTDRAIAQSPHWTGQEHQKDTTLRMLVDKHKPLKSSKSVKKLAIAKETVLDYRINKDVDDEDTSFRDIYKEKFTPIGSFDKIKTLADARIEEAIRQGQFKNIPRGTKLNTEVKPYVDRTEHHLNNILINQSVVPPWIEKQGGVNGDITRFRDELRQKWESHVRLFYEKGDDGEEVMRRKFIDKWKVEFENKVKLVNSSIRTYNLQAPLSTQKFYLMFDKEIDRCFSEVSISEIRERAKVEELKRSTSTIKQEDNLNEPSIGFSFKFWKWNN